MVKKNEILQRKATQDADLARLRSDVLSYRYEVDCLASDYRELEAEFNRLAPSSIRAVERYNELVDLIARSRPIRIAMLLRRWIHRIRTGQRLDEAWERMPLPGRSASRPRREGFPELPDLPSISYRAKPARRRLTWDSARFLSHRYYNQLDDILAERQSRQGVFVQTPIIDWFVPLYQRPQHMALAMAKHGYLVFYQTANCLTDRASGYHEVAPNVFLTNQPVEQLLRVPALYSFYSTAATLLAWQESGQVEQLRRHGGKVLFEYIDHIDPEISFHTTDSLARQFSRVSDETVDLGLASATSLLDELGSKLTRPPLYVPNGVDIQHYDRALDGDQRDTVPPAMREVVSAGRPVVGYFGAMAPWLWYDMLNELAASRPDLSFVFIGPDYLEASGSLNPAPNVYSLGAVDYVHLPFYAQHFDVCTIPFKPGGIAKSTSPLKLFEYFALGTPVVVTSGMDECARFNEVQSAGSAAEFSRQIDHALELGAHSGHRAKLRKAAEENSWEARARVVADAGRPLVHTEGKQP